MKTKSGSIFLWFILLSSFIFAQYDLKLDSIPGVDTCFVPTYDGSNGAVHPDLLYFKDGFTIQDSIIYFLMVMTPYPSFQSSLENPSVVYSCDGDSFYEWSEIHTNPLVFPNGSYNNDPDMIWDAEYESLYIIYQETERSKNWQDINLLANDSTIWNNTLPRTIIHYQSGPNQTWIDSIFTVSPSIIEYSDTLFMFYVHLMDPYKNLNGETNWGNSRIEILKSTTGIYQWDKEDITHAILHDKPAGLFIWHINVFDGQDGWFYMLCNGYEDSFWNNHNLFIARSTNLLDWYFFDDPILIENDPFFNNDCMGVYRSSGLLNKEMNLLLIWFSWYSETHNGVTHTYIGVKKFKLDSLFPPNILVVPNEFETIQDAINASQHGDIVLVTPGTYEGPINYLNKNVTVRSEGGPLVTKITCSSGQDIVTFEGGQTSAAVLEGFTLEGGRMAIWCKNSSPMIKNNLLINQNIENWAAIALSGEDWASKGSSGATILNNTIINSANGGISTFSTIAPTIKNNIITDCSYGIHFQNTGNTIAPNIDFNDIWNCGQNYINITDSGENSISADPMFTNHYAVYCGSPCIDGGDPVYFFNDPDGTRNDIGAVAVFQVLGEDDLQSVLDNLYDYNVISLIPVTYSISEPIDFHGKDLILMSHDYFSRATITTYNDTLDLFVFDESETESAELRNLILEGGRIAVWCKNASPTIRGNLIINQNVDNWASIALSGITWASSGNSPARIINNTIANSANGGISTFSTSAPEIRNNIIINCTYGLHKQSPFLPLVNDYNDVWNCSNNYINCSVGSNSISCNPDLNDDFRLNETSPCIDRGDPDTVYNDPDGSRNDMGWFPFYQDSYDSYSYTELGHSPVLWFNCSIVPEGFSISFHLSYPTDVKIDIYSVDGRFVTNFMEDYLNQGTHVINWNGKNISNQIVPNGVYFFTFRTGEIIKSFKSVVIR